MDSIAVIFDGSFDGLLTIIYKRFYEKLRPDFIYRTGHVQISLDTRLIEVETSEEEAKAVYSSIIKKISRDAMHTAYYAFLSEDTEIYIKIYRYILLGYKVGGSVNNHMQEAFVMDTIKTARYVGKEAHFSLEFMRFKETREGFLYGEFSPKSNCLSIVALHFADRFIGIPWLIQDVRRKTAAVFDGKEFIITDMPGQVTAEFAEKEEDIISLWKTFHKTIANELRVNPKLQTNMLPKRYRKHMTEFKP